MAKKTLADLGSEASSAFDAFITAAVAAIESGEIAVTVPEKPEAGTYDRAELEEMGIKDLRDLAKRHGIDTIKKAEIIDALAADEDEDAEDDEDETDEDVESDEDDEEADDEGDAYTREELEEMSLRDLRALAKDSGYDPAEVKALDQDELVDLLLDEGDDDEDEGEEDEDDEDYDDEDEADDEEEDDEEGDEEEIEIDEDALNAMDLAELKEVASDLEVKIPRNAKKPQIIQAILDSAE